MKVICTLNLLVYLAPLTALAHPGPAGHTHDDDWPFDPLPLALIVAILAAIAMTTFIQRRLATSAKS